MKTTLLIDYLHNLITDLQFSKEIENEVYLYIQNRSKSSSAILVDATDSSEQKMTNKDIISLLAKYINGSINEIQLEYILNFIEFSSFDISAALLEKLFVLSTPELFGDISKEKVQIISNEISTLTSK